MNIEHPFILDILKQYCILSRQNKIVEFCWIPSHIGIYGNSKADKPAKDALKFDIAQFQIPYTDLKLFIKVYVNSLLQIYWDSYHTIKHYSILKKINKPCNIIYLNAKMESLFQDYASIIQN
jgi:hypothetical protein